ncbi:MAG: hypothetical protein UH229_05525, partial [Lachnospiraceae bacterium]|nr:hypothetical protein [Lachnospiraceae bacterium]
HIEIPKTELRAYDAYGAKGYILDAGDYYFTVANGSHEAVNNILAAKGYTTANGMTEEGNKDLVDTFTQDKLDTEIFRKSAATGAEITNLFDESDPNLSSLQPGNVIPHPFRLGGHLPDSTSDSDRQRRDRSGTRLQAVRRFRPCGHSDADAGIRRRHVHLRDDRR